jgi:hypothetical protein
MSRERPHPLLKNGALAAVLDFFGFCEGASFASPRCRLLRNSRGHSSALLHAHVVV